MEGLPVIDGDTGKKRHERPKSDWSLPDARPGALQVENDHRDPDLPLPYARHELYDDGDLDDPHVNPAGFNSWDELDLICHITV